MTSSIGPNLLSMFRSNFYFKQIEIATQGTKEPEIATEKKEKKVEEVAEERHSIDELLETSEEENDYVSVINYIKNVF